MEFTRGKGMGLVNGKGGTEYLVKEDDFIVGGGHTI